MPIQQLTSPADLQRYDAWVSSHPEGTLWQSLAWKTYQEALGRQVRVFVAETDGAILASALVVVDRTSFGLSTWDIPRGPLGRVDSGQWTVDSAMQQLIGSVMAEAKKDRCLTLFFSPLKPLSTVHCPLSTSARHEQPEATRIINLRESEEAILAQMHPKGRYNIGVARKHGVVIRESNDVDAWYHLVQETSKRDGFRVPPKKHYETFLNQVPGTFLLLAYPLRPTTYPLAGLIGVIYGHTGIYYYGASSYEHRALMAPYLLQWEAIRRCKAQGCHFYDLLGVSPPAANPRHPWQGVSAFKAKLGGSVISYPAEQQVILRPISQRLLSMKRRLLG